MSLAAMCGDVSYEGARGIIGPYLGLLGASATAIGFVAGLGELCGYGLRVWAGWLADRTRAYFFLTGLGYGLTFGAIAGLGLLPLLVSRLGPGRGPGLAVALGLVLLERIGKAVRSPARSQLVATAARTLGEGKGFGLDEALDQIGAVSGPLLCGLVMWLAAGQGVAPLGRYRLAFVVLALPWLVNGLLLLRARRQPLPAPEPAKEPAALAALGGALKLYLVALALLAAGFVDWALVGLHISRSATVPAGWVPFLYAGAMAADGLFALGLGALFDRWQGRRGVLTLAIGALLAAVAAPLLFLDWPLGSSRWLGLLLGVALWGAAMGAQESVCKAAIARFVPSAQRGRAYGTFYALFGVSWWLGSTLLGFLYDRSRLLLCGVAVGSQLLAVLILCYVALSQPKKP